MSPEHFILDSHEINHFRFIYFRIPRTVLPPLSLITSTLTTKPSDFQPIKMFRRLSNSLPKDPEFPADLEKLGLIFPSPPTAIFTNPGQILSQFKRSDPLYRTPRSGIQLLHQQERTRLRETA